MDGRAFLDVGRRLAQQHTEADCRTAPGRAYYALLLECCAALQRWGFAPSPRDNIHTWVRLRLTYATDLDVKTIGLALEKLGKLRNEADYHLRAAGSFTSAGIVQRAVATA